MSSIFNLSKVSKLIENSGVAHIFVLDTNVVMKAPNVDEWSAKADGPSVFIISDTIIQELQLNSQKSGTEEKKETREKARKAIRSLAAIYDHGNITEGIPITGGLDNRSSIS